MTVKIQASDDSGEFTVTDEGVGIPTEELPKLFTRFHRIVRPELENIRSTGLGLYMVNKLVSGMGGEVHVESTEGVGSQFRVLLPLSAPSERQAA